MSYLNFTLLFFTLKIIFCDCCLRTPTVDSAPTIVTSTMNPNPCDNSFTTTTDLIIVSEEADGTGVFMIEVTCPATRIFLFINGMDFVTFPQTFACDATTGKYTFLPGSGIPTPINTLDCS